MIDNLFRGFQIPTPSRRPSNLPVTGVVVVVGIFLITLVFLGISGLAGFGVLSTYKNVMNTVTHPPGSQPTVLTTGTAPGPLTGPMLVKYQVGDTWSYSVTGTVTSPKAGLHHATGVISKTILSSTLSGQPALDEQTAIHLVLDDGSEFSQVGNVYFSQTPARDYIELGYDEGSVVGGMKAMRPQIVLYGDWDQPPPGQVVLNYLDGMSQNLGQNITSANNLLTISTGQKAECWTLNRTSSTGNQGQLIWSGPYCPALGQYVEYSYTGQDPSTGTMTATAKLTGFKLLP